MYCLDLIQLHHVSTDLCVKFGIHAHVIYAFGSTENFRILESASQLVVGLYDPGNLVVLKAEILYFKHVQTHFWSSQFLQI